jgi:hypothetical protein
MIHLCRYIIRKIRQNACTIKLMKESSDSGNQRHANSAGLMQRWQIVSCFMPIPTVWYQLPEKPNTKGFLRYGRFCL